mmetsp:Transcript_45660/g.113431  ORF Transcript_45660/g.113431 Transcript_45660/m.113431 type:complete len:118 (+) Transcript_45660:968-1321(+)
MAGGCRRLFDVDPLQSCLFFGAPWRISDLLIQNILVRDFLSAERSSILAVVKLMCAHIAIPHLHAIGFEQSKHQFQRAHNQLGYSGVHISCNLSVYEGNCCTRAIGLTTKIEKRSPR